MTKIKMLDISLITSTLTGIESAFNIAKYIMSVGPSIETASLKLNLSELMSSLADSKAQIAEIKNLLVEKDSKIKFLEEQLKDKTTIVRYKDAVYRTNDQGNPSGHPLCLGCWENSNKKVSLATSKRSANVKFCPSCNQEYTALRTKTLKDPLLKFDQDDNLYCVSCYETKNQKNKAESCGGNLYRCTICNSIACNIIPE